MAPDPTEPDPPTEGDQALEPASPPGSESEPISAGDDREDAGAAARRARLLARSAQALRRTDQQPALVAAAGRLRRMLPGDRRFGDPLSVAGDEPTALVGRTVSALSPDRPSAARELGLGALQVWQALSEAQGRGRGDRELALLFTDLVGFSSWALRAGDAAAVELLRQVGVAVEGSVAEHDGRIVKRLGDGVMAVFDDAPSAVRAALEAHHRLEGIEVAGHRPSMRAGLHWGRPRRLGGDYLGLDVNIAARVADAAGGGELLISDTVCPLLADELRPRGRGKRLKAPGAPSDLRVHRVA